MCFGGRGGSTPPPPAPAPAPAPMPKVMTASNLGKSAAKRQRQARGGRKGRSSRQALVIPRTGIQYTSSGSGVNA